MKKKKFRIKDYNGLTPSEAVLSYLCTQYEWTGNHDTLLTMKMVDYRQLMLELRSSGRLIYSKDDKGRRLLVVDGPIDTVYIRLK
jgi:hypothetical protein